MESGVIAVVLNVVVLVVVVVLFIVVTTALVVNGFFDVLDILVLVFVGFAEVLVRLGLPLFFVHAIEY